MVNRFMHRVVDEVHGVADIVEHASVGHDQVAVFESLLDAGREEGQRSFNPEIDQATISAALEPAGELERVQAQATGRRTHFVYLLHLVKTSTRQE